MCTYTRGVRRGGLTPVLAPRMPTITKDVHRQIETEKGKSYTTSTAEGYMKNMSRLNEGKETTGIRFN